MHYGHLPYEAKTAKMLTPLTPLTRCTSDDIKTFACVVVGNIFIPIILHSVSRANGKEYKIELGLGLTVNQIANHYC